MEPVEPAGVRLFPFFGRGGRLFHGLVLDPKFCIMAFGRTDANSGVRLFPLADVAVVRGMVCRR